MTKRPKYADLVDSKGAAEILGVKVDTIYTYKARGRMPAPYYDGRSPLWRREDIEGMRDEQDAD